MLSRNFFCIIVRVLDVTGIGVLLVYCLLLLSMASSNIDIPSGVLGDVSLGEVTVFTFVGGILLMIHDLLFLLVTK